jgi:hypothetical protein
MTFIIDDRVDLRIILFFSALMRRKPMMRLFAFRTPVCHNVYAQHQLLQLYPDGHDSPTPYLTIGFVGAENVVRSLLVIESNLHYGSC